MDEKEKYRAKIKARLTEFDETLNEIKTKKKQRSENLPEIEATIQKNEAAKASLKAFEESGDDMWDKFKTELDQYVDDIDEEVRQALAYFG